MPERLKIGGAAQLDGVMIRSEHFSTTVRCIEGDDPHYELVEKKTQTIPKWLEILSQIPLIRGMCLPLFLAWQLKGGTLAEGMKNQKGPSMIEKAIGLVILFAIFVPFILIANVYCPPGLIANSVALAPLILIIGGGIIWMRKCAIDALKYHGAEHKAVWAYDDTGNLPDVEAAKKRSRLHPRCGSCLIANQFVAFVVFSLIFPHLSALWICLLMQIASTELMAFARLKFFGKVLNGAGMALQHITTVEPDEKHLRAAVAATRSVLILETALDVPELPRTRKFKDLAELEAAVG